MYVPPHSVANIACSVLFDFAAAFPSVFQAWLLLVLKAIQAPEGFINTFTSMYSENHAYSRNQGGLVLMFKVFSGVLQGCPLSGHSRLQWMWYFGKFRDNYAAVRQLARLQMTLPSWSKMSGNQRHESVCSSKNSNRFQPSVLMTRRQC